MNNDIEIWKPIKDTYLYEVSNFGRIRSLAYSKIRIKKTAITHRGYERVNLVMSNGNKKNYVVHRLVAREFLGESILHVNHIDKDKTNNKLSNLEYVSCRENIYKYMELNANKSSKYVGVCKATHSNRWRAYFNIGKNQKILGTFDTQEAASESYQKRLKLFNENQLIDLAKK